MVVGARQTGIEGLVERQSVMRGQGSSRAKCNEMQCQCVEAEKSEGPISGVPT